MTTSPTTQDVYYPHTPASPTTQYGYNSPAPKSPSFSFAPSVGTAAALNVGPAAPVTATWQASAPFDDYDFGFNNYVFGTNNVFDANGFGIDRFFIAGVDSDDDNMPFDPVLEDFGEYNMPTYDFSQFGDSFNVLSGSLNSHNGSLHATTTLFADTNGENDVDTPLEHEPSEDEVHNEVQDPTTALHEAAPKTKKKRGSGKKSTDANKRMNKKSGDNKVAKTTKAPTSKKANEKKAEAVKKAAAKQEKAVKKTVAAPKVMVTVQTYKDHIEEMEKMAKIVINDQKQQAQPEKQLGENVNIVYSPNGVYVTGVFWRAPDNDTSIPITQAQEKALVAQLVEALHHNQGCLEVETGNEFLNRWVDGATYYHPHEFEALARELLVSTLHDGTRIISNMHIRIQ